MFSSKIILVILTVLGLGGFGVAAASSASSPAVSVNDTSTQGVHVTYYQNQDQQGNLVKTANKAVTVKKSAIDEQDVDVASDVSGTITSTETLTTSNPVANAIALHFGVVISDVVQLHDSGWGFGEIYRLYELAKLTGKSVADIQVMRDAGMGWGQIEKSVGVKPGNAGDNLGSIMSGRAVTDTLSLKKSNAHGQSQNHGNSGNHGGSKKP